MGLCHICYNITGRKFVTKKGFHVLEFKREVKAVEYSITSGYGNRFIKTYKYLSWLDILNFCHSKFVLWCILWLL